MESRISLIEEIKKGGYETSLITTFNAYLPFYEEVILRKLIGNGVRHNVLMMDKAQCQQSFSSQPPSFAGRRYSLIPMSSSGAFHPKIIMLLGKEKGLLAIGSHNLTLSGFGNNRELTNVVHFKLDDAEEAAGCFRQVLDYLMLWMEAQDDLLPKHMHEMVKRLDSFSTWLKKPPAVSREISIIGTNPKGESLWRQLQSKIEGDIERALIGGAFFDSELDFIKSVKKDLSVKEIFVGIDPNTVKAPPLLSDVEGIKVVNTSQLAYEGADDGVAAQYLHAKYMMLQASSGKEYLITGSANPSAPAWLSPGNVGNTEMMLVRSDGGVIEAIEVVGLNKVFDFPEISESEWGLLGDSWASEEKQKDNSFSISVAVCSKGRISFSVDKELFGKSVCVLRNGDGGEIDSFEIDVDSTDWLITPNEEHILEVALIELCISGVLQANYLVHHEEQLNEQSRTGSQRKFREALSSLSFSSPDLETFLACVDKIIFSRSEEINEKSGIKVTGEKDKKAEKESDESGFAIDVSETKKIKKKNRLEAKDDLAYLLDVLLYHLKVEQSDLNAYDSVDDMGRNEEEQVGKEDSEEEKDKAVDLSEDDAKKVIQLCHRKVKSLVSRMDDNLIEFKKNSSEIEGVVVKLTGVLAVLRELRNCDNTQSWVGRGQTTVPLEVRQTLLASILENLYEGNNSLWQIEDNNPDVSDKDEIKHLKGLILWLAWDCGAEFKVRKDFGKSPEKKELKKSAWFLAVAQLIKGCDDVIANAEKNIGPFCNGDLVWLKWLVEFSKNLEGLKTAEECPNGDLAMNENEPSFGFRLVKSSDDKIVSIIKFDKKRLCVQYQANYIKVISSKS